MTTRSVFLIIALSGVSLATASCSAGPANVANNGTNASTSPGVARVNDNIEELGLLVKLPFSPEEAVWKETSGPGSARKILAVLKFSPEDTRQLLAASGAGRAVSATVEEWYPAELVAQSDTSGDNALQGTQYDATAFVSEGFASGRLVHVKETDFFVLEMNSN
jgi:hypothetical protein